MKKPITEMNLEEFRENINRGPRDYSLIAIARELLRRLDRYQASADAEVRQNKKAGN